MLNFADNYYARLGLPFDANREEIRHAYHEAARRLHPDANPSPGAVEQFLKIQEAYEVLIDAEKRTQYDKTLPASELSPGLNVDVLYSQKGLVASSDPQLLYVLLELLPAAPAKQDERATPLNLCVVIDKSTSMQGERMDTVKATVSNLLHQLRAEDYLSVVTFSDRAEVVVSARQVNSNLDKIQNQIVILQTGGGTEMYQGLRLGLEEVSRHLRPNFINHLILVTDGHTYGDEQNCLKLADEARELGVTITGLGIGSEWNDKFMDVLTSKTGGNSLYVSEPRDIKRFLELKFSGLNRIYAENVRLEINKSPDVEIQYAFRLAPDTSNIPIAPTLALGNLQRNSGMIVVLELFVKQVPAGDALTLVEGKLRYEIPTRLIPVTRTSLAIVRPILAEYVQAAPPQKLVQAMSRLTLYRMQEQARKDLEDGNIEQATRRLRFLATHLLAQGESALATTVLGEASRLERDRTLSDEGEKRIKYGTRALLLPPGTGVSFK